MTTTAAGRFTILRRVTTDTAYYVTVSAPGFVTDKRLLRVASVQAGIGVDIQLAADTAKAALPTVQVRAAGGRVRPAAPNSASASNPEIGSDEYWNWLMDGLMPIDWSNPELLAQMSPSMFAIPTPDGATAIIANGGVVTSVAIDGTATGATSVPSQAVVDARLTSASFDVARHGFNQGQFALRTRSAGARHTIRDLRVDVTPSFRGATFSREADGAIGVSRTVSFSQLGAFTPSLRYYGAFDVTQTPFAAPWIPVNTARPTSATDLLRDSVARLFTMMRQYGLPVSPATPSWRATPTRFAGFLRVEYAPLDVNRARYWLVMNGGVQRFAPGGSGALTLPSQATRRLANDWTIRASTTRTFATALLHEFRVTAASWRNVSEPFLQFPSMLIDLGSPLGTDLSSADVPPTTVARVGGNTQGRIELRHRTLEITEELRFPSALNIHTIGAGVTARFDRQSAHTAFNPFGLFTYASLADFDEDSPSSYTRIVGGTDQMTTATTLSAFVQDQWRVTPALRVTYGAVMDVFRFPTRPPLNTSIVTRFGRRTDVLPSAVTVSPRIGFTWTHESPSAYYIPSDNVGVTFLRSPMSWRGTILRGGLGRFVGTVNPGTVTSAFAYTGLPSSVRQLLCTGNAVPPANLTQMAANPSSGPMTCLDGTSSSPFVSTQPTVFLVHPSFRPPSQWIGNLSWSTGLRRTLRVSVDGTYAVGTHQPSVIDLNLQRTHEWQLDHERDRPVYAAPAAIVPQTGLVTDRSSRIDTAFSQVFDQRSDLHTRSRRITVALTQITRPTSPSSWLSQLSYSYGTARDQVRGFGPSGSTAGNPEIATWGRSDVDVRHKWTLVVRPITRSTDRWRFTTYGILQSTSGIPFTPLVQGDINGDGNARNDRAMVFDPTTISDPVTAAEMTSLLQRAPRRVRTCLQRLRGTIATRNSCEGPWTTTFDLFMTLSQAEYTAWHPAVTVALRQIPAGLDQLLHGKRHPRGWGTARAIDPVLLNVRGFDPSAPAFIYAVNQNFGRPLDVYNEWAPRFRMTVSITMPLGLTWNQHTTVDDIQSIGAMLPRWQGDPHTLVRSRYRQRFGLPTSLLVLLRDTLDLSDQQMTAIQTLDSAYLAQIDPLLSPLVERVTAQAASPTPELFEDVRRISRSILRIRDEYLPRLQAWLTPEQLEAVEDRLGW